MDGGASGFRAYRILASHTGKVWTDARSFEGAWPYKDTLTPIPIEEQLRGAGRPPGDLLESLETSEASAARLQVSALLDGIEACLDGDSVSPIVIGLCMPGVPTLGGRGIAVSRHGPRNPGLLDALESGCHQRGWSLARPLAPLLGDGQAACLGEFHATQGQLCGVCSGYFVGGGSGLAEGVLLDGVALDLRQHRSDLPPAWIRNQAAVDSLDGRWEDRLSIAGMARGAGLDSGQQFVQAAKMGIPHVHQALAQGGRDLAGWLLLRLEQLHAWRGVAVECIVLGQRTGQLLSDPELSTHYGEPLKKTLEEGLLERQDTPMARAYIQDGALRSEFLRPSLLRAAPALGMGAVALGLASLESPE